MSVPIFGSFWNGGKQVYRTQLGGTWSQLEHDEIPRLIFDSEVDVPWDSVYIDYFGGVYTRQFISELYALEKIREQVERYVENLRGISNYQYNVNCSQAKMRKNPILIPLIKTCNPKLMASEICSVQPMTGDYSEINKMMKEKFPMIQIHSETIKRTHYSSPEYLFEPYDLGKNFKVSEGGQMKEIYR